MQVRSLSAAARPLVLVLLAAVFGMIAVAPTWAQEEAGSVPVRADQLPSEEDLALQLLPLRKDQLAEEVDGWVSRLQQTVTQLAQAELSDAESDTVRELRQQRDSLVARTNVAIAKFADKGGDVEEFELYVAAVSGGAEVQTDDVGAIAEAARDWVTSPDGGIKVGMNIVKFIVMVIVAMILARIAGSIVSKAVSRVSKVSELLRNFFVNVTRQVVFFVGLVIALSFLGINIGPLLAAIGGVAFIIGFALQGTLSNFASGIMILLYRPYDIGSVINVAGQTGKVESMTLVSTTMLTFDNQRIVVPNNNIWGDVITNITGNDTRRVDMTFGIGYSDDIEKAQRILEEIVTGHPKVLAEPAPTIKMHELADSSVNFVVRPWSATGDYWDVYWDVMKTVKQRFDAEGISIPFPQRDVHVYQEQGA
ncbi:MAG: mechanosensitive ion channel family protein [Planctomycetota bacterium]